MQLPITLLGLTLHDLQFPAILGDLLHKQDLYLATGTFAATTTCAFSNCNQAHFISTHHADLIPPGHWGNHSLGTFFEYYYYSNLSFRLSYPASSPICVC
uniref:HP3 n=1 Tax=Agave tequilana deltaflexivirus 1 TaxID=2794415 RepID=A0A7T5QZ69_9VIRU|nr:HP3 [Agave tequilana deltaflexivirus 1]